MKMVTELSNEMSELERELYEKAHDAAKEAQRQGDEQLQAAVAAAGAATPLRMCQTASSFRRFNWSLKFKDPRMEKAYEGKCNTSLEFLDLVATACEVALCIFHLWMAFQAFSKKNSMSGVSSLQGFHHALICLCLHLSALAFNTLVLILQLGRYNINKGGILWYYPYFLWIWASVSLFVTTIDLWLMALELFIQCIFIGLIYHAPFCLHMQSRIFGFGCQSVSLVCRGKVEGALVLLLSICMGHLFGLTSNYWLDYRARVAFVQTFPRWLVDDTSHSNHHSASSYRATYTRKLWKVFYPELLDDDSEPANLIPHVSSERVAPHRALGGFAGGFGGVSGLKYRNASPAVPLSSSSNSLSGEELSDSSDEFWADSADPGKKASSGLKDPNAMLYNLNQGYKDTWAQQATSSAPSEVGSDRISQAMSVHRRPTYKAKGIL